MTPPLPFCLRRPLPFPRFYANSTRPTRSQCAPTTSGLRRAIARLRSATGVQMRSTRQWRSFSQLKLTTWPSARPDRSTGPTKMHWSRNSESSESNGTKAQPNPNRRHRVGRVLQAESMLRETLTKGNAEQAELGLMGYSGQGRFVPRGSSSVSCGRPLRTDSKVGNGSISAAPNARLKAFRPRVALTARPAPRTPPRTPACACLRRRPRRSPSPRRPSSRRRSAARRRGGARPAPCRRHTAPRRPAAPRR